MTEIKPFAKIFDDPDYGQIVVIIDWDQVMDFKPSVVFIVNQNGSNSKMYVPYATDDEAYQAFLDVDYKKAKEEAARLFTPFDDSQNEGGPVEFQDNVDIVDETYNENAIWQEGEYALKRLYHEAKTPLVVIYTSPTCPPCHMVKPQIRRVIDELNGAVKAVEIDIEKYKNIGKEAGVHSTPTVQVFHLKEFKKQFIGVKQRSEYKEFLEELINVDS